MKVIQFLRIIDDAMKIDAKDMNYVYSNPLILDRLLSADPSGLPRKGVLVRIFVYLYKFISNIKPLVWIKYRTIESGSTIFYAQSLNQLNSLERLSKNVKHSVLFSPNSNQHLSFHTFIAYLFSLIFFPLVLKDYIKSEGLIRTGFHYNLNQYLLTYGFYISMRLWLNRFKPNALVFSNDHNMENRVLEKASHDEGITTAYLQHASVSSFMPPLSFNYALLDGRDALYVYDEIGSSETIIYLVGISKFDDYIDEINLKDRVDSIGICTNWLEPFDRIEELCRYLKNYLSNLEIYLRPHPHDKRERQMRELVNEIGIKMSDSNEEGVFDFLNGVDLILAGNSNIHLEAALLNVYPIFYDFTLNPDMEIYSFLKTGLCEYSSNPDEAHKKILSILANKPNIRDRAKVYCNTVGTKFDGLSTELASSIISKIANNKEISKENWLRIDGVSLEAYEHS